MKKTTIILTAAILWTASCTPRQEYNTIQRNILTELQKTDQHISSFVFTEYTITDTVMTGEALDECIELHARKAEKAKENAEIFRKRHRRRNAEAWDSVAFTAQRTCLELRKLKQSSGKELYDPLYYCIRFSGRTFAKDENLQVNGYYATADTKGNIRNLQSSANGLHNGMGILIPEYTEILKKCHGKQ